MIQPDYFEVLPCHPFPKPFESLTSYLARLAQGNGLTTIQGLKSISFPKDHPGPVNIPPDLPPAAWGILPTVTTCPEPVLLETTLYYLAQKFGRTSSSQAMGRFLQGKLSNTLRYCPTCLAEDTYYALPWRFLTLTGCAKHGARLLDRCDHCGQTIPLLSTPFRVGFCPSCRGDLRRCQADPLADQAWQTMREHEQDLRFLLAAHRPPTVGLAETVQSIGLRFVYWRLKRGLVAFDVSQQVEFPSWTIYALEGRTYGAPPFERYVQYAAHLGVTLRQVFNTTLPSEINDQNWRAWCRTTLFREQHLVEQVRAAIKSLEATDQLVSHTAIARIVGLSTNSLQRYPQVKKILDQITADRELLRQQYHQQREQTVIRQARHAVDRLKAENKSITQRRVCGLIGITKDTLSHYYPHLKRLIAEAATEYYLTRHQQLHHALHSQSPRHNRETELVTAVQAAIKSLQAQNKLVTQKAVCHVMGMHLGNLRRYPRVKLCLELIAVETNLACQRQVLQTPSKPKQPVRPVDQQREAELVEAVQLAINQLTAAGQPVGQKSIAKHVGLVASSLSRYPQIRQIFTQLIEQRNQRQQEQKQQREQQLIEQVQAAVTRLEALDQPLTQANIVQLVGIPASTLRNYPPVKAFLNQIKAKRLHAVRLQAQQRDQDLVEKTKQAAETLTRLGQRVTKHAIGQMVGLTPTGYKKYPLANKVLDQVTWKR